jgi:hypothetical protein
MMAMLHSISGAPLIRKKPDLHVQVRNATPYETAEIESDDIDSDIKLSLLELEEDGDLFEGDIIISEDVIRKYYNLSSIPGGEEYLDELTPTNEGSLDNGFYFVVL